MLKLIRRIDDNLKKFEESRAFGALVVAIGLVILYTMLTSH